MDFPFPMAGGIEEAVPRIRLDEPVISVKGDGIVLIFCKFIKVKKERLTIVA